MPQLEHRVTGFTPKSRLPSCQLADVAAFSRVQACRAASVESSPPLWRVHERRVARASAQRRARPMVVLSGRLLGASAWAAAGAAGAGSRDRAHRQAGTIINWRAGSCHLPPVDGSHRYCGRSAAKERRLSRRAGRAWLAAVAGADAGWPRWNVWSLRACTHSR